MRDGFLMLYNTSVNACMHPPKQQPSVEQESNNFSLFHESDKRMGKCTERLRFPWERLHALRACEWCWKKEFDLCIGGRSDWAGRLRGRHANGVWRGIE
jgi:hypothetical protein